MSSIIGSATREFLTEESLGDILRSIFPVVNSQVRVGSKTYDYEVKLQRKDIQGFIIINLDDLTEDEADVYLEDGISLFFEYNGKYHYTSPVNCEFEESSLKWINIGDSEYLLQIPYWLQPTPYFSRRWFGVDKDFSSGFPQGFISKRTILPGLYCRAGVERFIKEYSQLPLDIRDQVLTSLYEKCFSGGIFKPKKMSMAGGIELFKRLMASEDKLLFWDIGDFEQCCRFHWKNFGIEGLEKFLRKIQKDLFTYSMICDRYQSEPLDEETVKYLLKDIPETTSKAA